MRKALVVVALMLSLGMVFTIPSALAGMPAPGPNGEQCSVDHFEFIGLGNSTHPNEIGFKTVLGCNFAMFSITGHQWLLNTNGHGGWISIHETYAQKSKSDVLALTMFSWYKCGSVDTWASNHLQSKASWDMNFDTGFNTAGFWATEHWSKCYNPYIVEFT